MPPQPASPGSYDETVKELESVARATAAAWRRPGALEQKIKMGAGEMPGSALATMAQDKFAVHKLFEDLAPRYAERLGGYTRILKLGPRRSDATEMVYIELV